ncbi:hypothetical protein [Paraburkholderia kururiensis]|uniref:Uncharacterized protein n=1 Tax=Paraburkholderia kururiensis TaxID=984307 RepID=A0ABZ0WSY5_9BURK|nr:hypothetical protein [Paraburkholderia kururiensis]WQD80350.1 hypothetical protein U0042_12080 [Paraburkholderia kururiensis]
MTKPAPSTPQTDQPHPDAAHPVEPADERLDEALEETFPASDPIAVDPAEPPEKQKHKP